MKFIGRNSQLEKLNHAIEKTVLKGDMQNVLIYGRRRVGKSELIKQILRNQDIPAIYYECRQVAEASNVQGLAGVLSETLNLPPLGFNSIEAILDYIFRRSCDSPLILVLDEYPYLRENTQGMDSILQALIDQYRGSAKIVFVLLGSYVDIMKGLFAHENPLFGRMDLVMDLKPMDYLESSQFYPSFSDEDKVRTYSVFGGIPYYCSQIDDQASFKENLMELIVMPDSRFENEVSGYLNSEISKIANANETFGALARGYTKYSDILSQSHVSSGPTLVDVLDKLTRMELIEKRTPINDEGNRRKASYHIGDNLSAFYYRYIFRYSSQRNLLDPEAFYKKYVEEDFESNYVPRRFEDICRQYLIRQNREGNIDPPFEKIGKYYYDLPKEHRNGEFDIVTEDEEGYVFYEVKFRKETITASMVRKEIEQVRATGMKCHKYTFFSRSEVILAGIEEPVEVITLDDLWKN